MAVDINAQLSSRLSAAEQDFLDAITDSASLAKFDSLWMLLVDDVKRALEADALTESTISMAYVLADKVASMGQTLLDLESLSEKAMSSLTLEASSILLPSHTTPTSTPSDLPLFHIPPKPSRFPYIELSYRWLLDNIHDPYPSTSVRDSIARKTGSARKDIDSWFIDARKRMGWNALRKNHFSNKRINIVDAATRFFVGSDPHQPLDNPQIELEFAAIEVQAKDLYSERFSESDLAAKLDTVVKDMTPEMKAQAKAEARRRRLLEQEENQIIRAISSYPSPARSSIRSSPSPLPLVSEDDMEITIPQSISQSSRKRRASPSDSSECDTDYSSGRLDKRSRFVVHILLFSLALADISICRIGSPSHTEQGTHPTRLPSPTPSNNELLASFDGIANDEHSTFPTLSNGRSRKRRLSDADGQGAPKRPRNLHVAPRPQAVSDPLPLSNAFLDASVFEGWFHQNIEFPSFPNIEADLAAPLEVELYDFSKIYDENQFANVIQYRKALLYASLLHMPHLLITASPQIHDHGALSPGKEVQSFDLDISTNSFNYGELFSSDELGGHGTIALQKS
jgi:hypothetical protein